MQKESAFTMTVQKQLFSSKAISSVYFYFFCFTIFDFITSNQEKKWMDDRMWFPNWAHVTDTLQQHTHKEEIHNSLELNLI